MTSFTGWEEPVNLIDMATIPLPFVFEHVDEAVPSSIGNGLCKAVVSNHVLDGKTFYMDSLVFADQLSAGFMKKVPPLISDLLMLLRKSYNCFLSVARTLSFPGNTFLHSSKLLLRLSKELRWLDHFRVGSGNEVTNTKVNPYFRPGILGFGYCNFAKDRSKILTGSRSGYSERFRCSLNRTVNLCLYSLCTGNVKRITFKRPSLRNTEGLTVFSFLKSGKLRPFVEEVIVSTVEVHERLLERLGIDFFQPVILFLLFKISKHCCCVSVSQSLFLLFLMFGIPVDALAKKVIIDKATASEVLFKYLVLVFVWIYSVLICFVGFHIINYIMFS